jgi:OmpA-OmpF porin, OOP family
VAQVKPQVKVIGGLLVVGILYFGMQYGVNHGYIHSKLAQSLVPANIQLPNVEDAKVADVKPQAFPSTVPNGCQDPIRDEEWAWNAQIGKNYANGGPDTTKGSLMEKYNVCMHITRQDDTTQMQNDLAACSKELVSSNECSSGQHFVTIMADGAGQFLAGLNATLVKNCPDCTAEIVGTTGFSRGEDALWGPASWKSNPKSALGDGLISGVTGDGDWDTGMKWASGNMLKNNPSVGGEGTVATFDPDALNWYNAADYIKAAEAYISGYCEDRKVIKNGKLTGETRNVCVKAVVTWTPGDVNLAEKKGGLVRIISTKQYRSQMPSAWIGIKKWDKSHPDKVASMLAATLEGGDQIKAFPEAKKRGGDISAKIYGEQDGAYWVKYYDGATERDATGRQVELGGSYADNMNDALAVFGVDGKSNNNVKATYTIFANVVTQQYPDRFTKTPIPPYEKVATTAYLLQAKGLLDNAGSEAETVQYSATAQPTAQFGDVNKDIEFNTGSAVLTPQGLATVTSLKDDLAITKGYITLDGHTDNTGNSTANQKLSEARANSVKVAIQKMAPEDFPESRFRINGFGDSKPIADNKTVDGRAKNRRVEVILAE